MTDDSAAGDRAALELNSELTGAGFNLAGVLSSQQYDALVAAAWRSAALLPGARSAVLLACGGPDFFRAVRQAPDWQAGDDPCDRFTSSLILYSAYPVSPERAS